MLTCVRSAVLGLFVLFSSLPSVATSTTGAAIPPRVKNPLLFQLNTKVLLGEISKKIGKQATLDDFPDERLRELKDEGYDWVYFLGVWQTGEFGMKKSIKLLDLEPCMKGLPREAASSSPFAVTDYSCHSDFGGDEALLRLRDRCHARGLRLMLDFVPNHMAVDHPWTTQKPQLLMQGSENSVRREPQNFFKVGDKVFAHGKDMYYDGWEDTVQINYGSREARGEMCKIINKLAGLCDGIRCDMAMLLCEDVLEKTWGGRLAPFGQERAKGQFWPGAIKEAKEINPDFTFCAECYWDREYQLQTFGFDYCYDKTLYDRLKEYDVGKVRGHLMADYNYQKKLVRFLENHDEERAADSWKNTQANLAAATISYTIPGLHFVHDGQQEGRTRRISMHVNMRVGLNEDVKDPNLSGKYARLIKAVGHDAIKNGHWGGCTISASGDGNPSHERLVSNVFWKDDTHELVFSLVNFCGDGSNGHIILPNHLSWLRGKKVVIEDLVHDWTFEKDGGVLLGDNNGLWFQCKPFEYHIFKVSAK